VIKKIMKKLIL